MTRRVLVVGGTGPTGPYIVNEFLRDGAQVAIYHTGRHEVDFDSEVEHLHGDPRDEDDIQDKLGNREWDIAVCTSGRLRSLAKVLAGRTGRLVATTGQPVYRGVAARVPTPTGKVPLPVPEWAERQYDNPGYTGKVAIGEDQLMEQHGRGDFEVVILRYPAIFGPRAPINHEWAVVKRILDRRPFMIMPHDGMVYFQRGYAANVGRLVFLAGTRPEAAGEIFNAGDERVLSARHVAEIIVDELGSDMELIGVPAQLCKNVYLLAEKSNVILDMSKARNLLGYRDVVDPEEATGITARWLRDNPPDESDLTSPGSAFDYDLEDRIVRVWRDLLEKAQAELSAVSS